MIRSVLNFSGMEAANDVATLVLLASIAITHAERLEPAVFGTFEALDAVLRAFAVAGGRSKVWFTATWANGATWEGKIDVIPAHQFRASIIGGHVRHVAGATTGRRLLPGYTAEEQARAMAAMGTTAETIAFHAAILDGYDLGPAVTPEEEAAEDAAIATWKQAEKARLAAESQAALEATWWTGAKYDSALRVGEISRLVRAELTALGKASPSVLFGCTFKATSSGNALYLWITPTDPAAVVGVERARAEARNPHGHNPQPRWSERGEALLAAAAAVGNAYNYDKSDRGRGHDYTREHFMLTVEFAQGTTETGRAAVLAADAAAAV